MMKIKAIIFDLDGVLVSTKDIHYEALNKAIEEYDKDYKISYEEHLATFDGLPTEVKLNILVNKGLNKELVESIKSKKKIYTKEILNNKITYHNIIFEIFSKLKSESFILAVATNAIKETLDSIIEKLGITKFIDFKICNEDIIKSKPHAEMYLKCFLALGLNPKETLVLEDSSIGRAAAYNSGANVMEIEDLNRDVNYDKIISKVNQFNNKTNKIKWKSEKLNVLIPLAGKGQRFIDKGYVFPKPLISINNKPMIQIVVENIAIEANYIFVVLKEHYEKYNLKYVLSMITKNNCKIVVCDGYTEGAACTSLLAEKFIDNDNPLLIANSDQFIEWDSNQIMYSFLSSNVDGGILTFKSTHPKWSFAKTNDENIVMEVAEKKPISNNATVGIYYWRKGSDYVMYAKEMIKNKMKVGGEYYICPVYNLAIKSNKKIVIKEIDEMWGLGTPEDLEVFLSKKLTTNL